jgi:hypothetical protein
MATPETYGLASRVVVPVGANTTLAARARTDYIYICTAAPVTVTLPTAVGNTNRYTIKATAVGTVTVSTTSSQTIDGGASASLTQYQNRDLISDGANWIVL